MNSNKQLTNNIEESMLLNPSQPSIVRVSIWVHMYKIAIEQSHECLSVYSDEQYQLYFILCRCKKDGKMSQEYMHINACIGIYLQYLQDNDFEQQRSGFGVRFPHNDKVALCNFEMIDTCQSIFISNKIHCLIAIDLHSNESCKCKDRESPQPWKYTEDALEKKILNKLLKTLPDGMPNDMFNNLESVIKFSKIPGYSTEQIVEEMKEDIVKSKNAKKRANQKKNKKLKKEKEQQIKSLPTINPISELITLEIEQTFEISCISLEDQEEEISGISQQILQFGFNVLKKISNQAIPQSIDKDFSKLMRHFNFKTIDVNVIIHYRNKVAHNEVLNKLQLVDLLNTFDTMLEEFLIEHNSESGYKIIDEEYLKHSALKVKKFRQSVDNLFKDFFEY